MLDRIKEIKAGIGLGVLKFGMTREQVKLILGEPEEKDPFYYEEDGNSESESWYYDDLDLALEFDAEEKWRLITIEVNSRDYTFHKLPLIGLSKEELKVLLTNQDVTDWKDEELFIEEAPTRELISSDLLGINFWFEEGVISEIQWGPHFIDEETIKWPD